MLYLWEEVSVCFHLINVCTSSKMKMKIGMGMGVQMVKDDAGVDCVLEQVST